MENSNPNEQEQIEITEPQEQQPEEQKQEQPSEQEPELEKEIKEPETKEDLSEIKTQEQASEFLEKKGIKFSDLQAEYDKNGDLTKETREKLNSLGIDNETIDAFANGIKLQNEVIMNDRMAVVGGKESYEKIMKWAGANLTPDEIQAYNEVTNPLVQKVILKELKNQMEEKEGKPSNFIASDGGTKNVDVFESQAQMKQAIQNPQYAIDPAYRKKVAAKIRASRELGIDLGI